MKGQWEYQIFSKGAKNAGDQLWIARYLMARIAERHGVSVDMSPKPVKGDWNGSGMHANFSNGLMRTCGQESVFNAICEEFGKRIQEHITVYGHGNDQRLTGSHETQSLDKFSYGVSDRGASIRIPIATWENGFKGRLEDRRPASNADPYKVATVIIESTNTASV
jgi:glutamine synthetase